MGFSSLRGLIVWGVILGACGLGGAVFRGEPIDWGWVVALPVAFVFIANLVLRFARYVDSLEDRIRTLEQEDADR